MLPTEYEELLYDFRSPMFMLIFAFILLAIVLPFTASLVIDGTVSFFRKRGVAQLVIAAIATAVVALLGYGLWKHGIQQVAEYPNARAFPQTMRNDIAMFLPYTIGGSLLVAVARISQIR
jgi:hypothetical protein